jgi:hypothetical protein
MPAPRGNKNATGNKGGGRKPDYRKKFAIAAYKLTMLGATDTDLADFFEVSESTINSWKKKYVEFSAALKKGKAIADAEIVLKLYKRASGYKYDEVSYEKIIFDDKSDKESIKTELYKKRVVTKEVAPDVTAQIFWLKNRQKNKWKDRHTNTIDIDWEKLSDEDLDKVVSHVLAASNSHK